MSNDISDGCLYSDSLMAAMGQQDFTNGASALPTVPVEAQPLAANIERLDQALEHWARRSLLRCGQR